MLCTNVKLTLWHNWWTWVRLAWSRKTLLHALRRRLWSQYYRRYITLEGSLTFVVLPLSEEMKNLHIVCCFLCFQPWFELCGENGSVISSTNDARQRRREHFSNGFSILIGCLHRMAVWSSLFIGLFPPIVHFSPNNGPKCPTSW